MTLAELNKGLSWRSRLLLPTEKKRMIQAGMLTTPDSLT